MQNARSVPGDGDLHGGCTVEVGAKGSGIDRRTGRRKPYGPAPVA
jgi:hypothetical protein